ncbi:OmpA family protein [Histidinibacterium aquaticum]|uniref:OmpA family protein n=1 Tax=Histidinibacterium aquaticum TaxID=2613962 RepID=A0A5J5GRG2_9RHOB|nr:OmpA family protein [Histidinibacterium aquaticum]KAA9010313.1 OmpA family protein [Histidinibacterium aquaticum]
MRRVTLSAAALLALSACAQTAGGPGVFDAEAGAVIDTGTFGNATMHNTLVMNGERDYTVALAERFDAEVPSTVNFAFNSAQLGPEARAILTQQANWMNQFPELRFSVYGHTDLVGSDSYNYNLGLRRAQAAVNYLVTHGVPRSSLKALVSYGEEQPLVLTQNRERANRRTVTEVSGFLRRHPTVLNGKYAEVIFREYVQSAVPSQDLEGVTAAGLQ